MNSLQELLNPIYEVGAFGLGLAFYATFSAALLAVVALAVNLLFHRWITAGQMSLLWALVLVRLVLPIAPPSSFSLQGAAAKLLDDSVEVTSEGKAVDEWMAVEPTDETAASDQKKQVVHTVGNVPTTETYVRSSGMATASKSRWIEDAISSVLFHFLFAWPVAAVAIILWTIFVNFRFSWKVNRTLFCHDERLATLWAACCQQAKVRRTIPIVLMDNVQQPAMMGVVHHRLLLPQDSLQLSDDELRMIMLHELAHVRRWDIAMNWALVFIQAVQWWNPVYWLAASRFAGTREQACDAFVVRSMSGTSSRNYGELLLKLAEKMPGRSRWRVLVPTPILGFMLSRFRRRTIAARLRALPRATIAWGRWHAVGIAAATVLLAYAGLTDAKTASDEPPPEETAKFFPGTFERADVWPAEAPHAEQPVITRDYEVEPVLRQIAGERYSLDEAKKLLAATIWPMAPHKDHPQCDFNGSGMTVIAKESIHQELQQNLIAWEKSGLEQICIECRFITFRQEFFSRMDIPWRYFAASSPNLKAMPNVALSTHPDVAFSANPDSEAPLPLPQPRSDQSAFRASAQFEESLPVVYAILKPKQVTYVVDGAQGDPHTNVRQAPKVTLFNGQQGFLSDITQRPFVVGIEDDVPGVQHAHIAVAYEGTKIALRPVLSADHKRIQLNGRLEFSDVGEVETASVTSPVTDADPASIQVPNLKRLQIQIATELENGHSLLVGSLQKSRYERPRVNTLFILLTPSLVSDDGDSAR